jgi:hypothetical protein
MIPVVGKVRKAARDTQCRSNLHQIGVAVHLYANDNKNRFPPGHDYRTDADSGHPGQRITWELFLLPYLGAHMTGNVSVDYQDARRSKITACPGAEIPSRHPSNNIQYSANDYLTSSNYRPQDMTVAAARPSEIIFCIDGVCRIGGDGMSRNTFELDSHAAVLDISTSSPDALIRVNAPDEEWGIAYRHGSDIAQACMVDASVRAFKSGSIKSRNLYPDF